MTNSKSLEDTQNEIAEELATKLILSNEKEAPSSRPILLCDMGYGLPKEARPRKEKVLAIARQLVNFIEWQQQASSDKYLPADIHIVGCPDLTAQNALMDRMQQLWKRANKEKPFPQSLSFTDQTLQDLKADSLVYLSPDAPKALDPDLPPPSLVVVGLLIDRRIQVDRSKDRAIQLSIPSARWPIEQAVMNLDQNEPLNVDCILEGMQQWYWNCQTDSGSKCFVDAAIQAIQHHAQRHPERPVHKIL